MAEDCLLSKAVESCGSPSQTFEFLKGIGHENPVEKVGLLGSWRLDGSGPSE